MTDNEQLSKQLESLAQQNNLTMNELVEKISRMGGAELPSSSSVDYVELLTSATSLVTNISRLDSVLGMWFDYIENVITYDIGLLIVYEDHVANIRFIRNKSIADYDTDSYLGNELQLSSTTLDLSDDDIEFAIMNAGETNDLEEQLNLPDMKSAIKMPIVNNERVLGCLICVSQDYSYHIDELQKARPFVNILSGALQTVRLMTTVYQSTDELASLYHATSVLFQADTLQDFATQITEVVTRTFDYADCGLMIVDSMSGNIKRMKRSGPGVVQPMTDLHINGMGLVPKAIREKRMVYEPDVRRSLDYIIGDERSLCELVVPLKTKDGIVGVLDFQSLNTHAFSERDQRLIVAFAERVTPALENVLLYDQLRQHMTELEQHVKQRTFELENTKEQLETILRNSPDAIVLLDSQGRIRQANLSWLSMVGQSMYNVVGQRLSTFLPESSRELFHDMLEKTLHDELENDITVEIPHKLTSSQIEVEISLAPIIDDRESGVVCNIRDMTHHKESERLLREALEKSEELSQLKVNFVTMASHEFRTPLTTILSSSDIVAKYQDRLTPERIKNHMVKIQQEVDYLDNLIDDILLIGQSNDEGFTAKLQPINIVKLLKEVVERVRRVDKNQHPIDVKLAKNAKYVETDSKLITHIIGNLLTNACKYSAAGSPIYLSVNYKDGLHIVVKDMGIGIPPKDLEMLFDSFYRGSNVGNVRGTGIGLAIVHEALSALRGKIDVQSVVNQGTTISISLPLSNGIEGVTE